MIGHGELALEVKPASFHTGAMKANPLPALSSLTPIAALALAALASGCAPPPAVQAPKPIASHRPAPPPPPATPPANWRDAPLTPGSWEWSRTPTGSLATFAAGQFVVRCNTAQQSVTLLRAAAGSGGQVPMSITTTQGTRAVLANPSEGTVAVTLPARDPVLDAMAFSRGRFAIAAPGSPTLILPSWTEVSRVIEDCR